MRRELSIRRTVRNTRSLSSVPFEKLAHAIVGSAYELSLVICGDNLARRINKESRGRTYAPNVLSFPLSKNEGEIFLNIRKGEREAKTMGVRARARIAHLFVHGCFHLKGLKHGDAMDRAEHKILKRFKLSKLS